MEKQHVYLCKENDNIITFIVDEDDPTKIDEVRFGITGIDKPGCGTVIGTHDLVEALAMVGLRIIPSNELTAGELVQRFNGKDVDMSKLNSMLDVAADAGVKFTDKEFTWNIQGKDNGKGE